MNYKELITSSKTAFCNRSIQVDNLSILNVFESGAEWMHNQLNDNTESKFNAQINFTGYGIIKYSTSMIALIVSTIILYLINPFLIPLAGLIFYFVEVHFLFLFPLILDNVKSPFLKSIQSTYRIGILKTTFTVLQIGLFMLIGLFNFKDPLKNWYLGCLSVIIWYKHEIRDRIPT